MKFRLNHRWVPRGVATTEPEELRTPHIPMASQQPCLSCACTNPRLLSDVLGAIHIKRGQVRRNSQGLPLPPSCRAHSRPRHAQTTLCTATPALGLQFAVEVSSCLRAKVTLKSEMFSSLRLQRDVRVCRPPPPATAGPLHGA